MFSLSKRKEKWLTCARNSVSNKTIFASTCARPRVVDTISVGTTATVISLAFVDV